MSFEFEKITYSGAEFTVHVKKTVESDFAFYILLGTKRVGAKLYTKENSSSLEIILEKGKVYCLKLFNRPLAEKTVNESEKLTTKVFFTIDISDGLHVFSEYIIHESENLKITEYDQNSDITFVTFNSAQTDKTSAPFGGDFILSNGWNLIALHKANKNQYQDLSLELFEYYVKPRAFGKKVYIYGTSLGGYCACYFGGTLNATIIAGSPMLPVHPTINHPDYIDVEFKHKKISEMPKTSMPVFIIYDPLESGDVRFLQNQVLPAYPLPYLIPVKNGTHLVMKTLQRNGLLKPTVIDLMDNNLIGAMNRIIKHEEWV